MNKKHENEKGLLLGFSIIIILITLGTLPSFFSLESGSLQKGTATVLTGIYLQFWGILYLVSYYFSHKTFFFRGLIWMCENFSTPSGRKMAFFYSALAFTLGTVAVISGAGFFNKGQEPTEAAPLPPGIEPIENWWYKDPALYIILLLSAGYISYRYQKDKNKR